MRTTIRIDDEIYRRVKQVADQTDRTIGEVIEDAVHLAFRSTRRRPRCCPCPCMAEAGSCPAWI